MGWRDWTTGSVASAARPQVGWRVAGDDLYTCVAPPGFEKDAAVTEAIRSFDPEMVPAWRIQLWHPPGTNDVLKVVHHGIMRYYPFPRFLRQLFHVEVPQGWEGPVPNFMDVFFDDDEVTNHIGPGAYMPWDWHVYRYCRGNWVLLTQQKYHARIEAHRKRVADERRKDAEERAYKRGFFEKTALPMMDKITPEDWLEYEQLRQQRGRSARRTSVAIHRPGSGSPPKPLILPSGSPPVR